MAYKVMIGCSREKTQERKDNKGHEQRDDQLDGAQDDLRGLLLLEGKVVDFLQRVFDGHRKENP